MDITQTTGMAAIAVIVYLFAAVLKAFAKSEKICSLIPSFCGVFGGAISVICFFISPELIPAESWLSAFAAGAISGLSATGINQVSKQLSRKAERPTELNEEGDNPDA